MPKLSPIMVSLVLLTGCLSKPGLEKDLIGKSEGPLTGSQAEIQVYRIFGKYQGYLADYDPITGALRAVHKVLIGNAGRDFWPTLQEDSRVAREVRYFAVSRIPIPTITEKTEGGSFRADLFRGHPVHESAIGHNLLIRITGTRFIAPADKRSGTHIILGDAKEVHAVPQNSSDDLVSFSVVDGIKANDGVWGQAVLRPAASRPATTAMGCLQNFEGKLLADGSDTDAEFWGVCEKMSQAGL